MERQRDDDVIEINEGFSFLSAIKADDDSGFYQQQTILAIGSCKKKQSTAELKMNFFFVVL